MNATKIFDFKFKKDEFKWNATSKSIIRTLVYFNIFHFPLSKEELLKYCPSNVSFSDLESEIQKLVSEKYIFNVDGYFSVTFNPEITERRKIGNIRAQRMLQKAKKHIKWISILPFIESISISGSLSKLYADDSSDIDYFVITKPNRLWIFRTFTGVAVKILKLIGKFRYMCANYIIATDKLTIENKNVFSAIELITLIPVFGIDKYQLLIDNNQWVKEYFPSELKPNLHFLLDEKESGFKRSLAKISLMSVWDKLDTFLFNAHQWYYNRKFRNEDYQNVNYSISHFKMHTSRHRHRILTKYEADINEFEQKHSIDLEVKY